MILFTSPIPSAVHDMHIDAIVQYSKTHGLTAVRGKDGIGIVPSLFSSRNEGRYYFVESTGPSNLISVLLAKILRWKVVYYFHEPTSLQFKLKNKDGLFKSIAKHIIQTFDAKMSDIIFVSREKLRDDVADLAHIARDKIHIAPLLFSEMEIDQIKPRKRITYLGRVDSRRRLREFVSLTRNFIDAGLVPTVLTGDPALLKSAINDFPDGLEVYAQEKFSEELKAKILSESCLVWNPKTVEIAQSGVTADAMRFGCTVLLTPLDPDYHSLQEDGASFDCDSLIDAIKLGTIDSKEFSSVNAASLDRFRSQHGASAFERFYLQHLG